MHPFFALLPVCCEEESRWNLGMQGLWEVQGWWRLHHEVRPFLIASFLPEETHYFFFASCHNHTFLQIS